MTLTEIKRTQARVGATPDGFWGPLSTDAAKRHLRAMFPKNSPFPRERGNEVAKFYGPHGVKNGFTPPMKSFRLPFTVFYEDTPVTKLSAHVLCADSLERVFHRLAEVFPSKAKRQAAGILTWDGIYNPRLKKGGSTWSMHSWAIAIDLNASKNGNLTHWPTKAVMPIEVMECFAKEGWLSAGAFWSRDAMHFQATAP